MRVVVISDDSVEQWRVVHELAGWFEESPVDGIYGSVPTYDSLLIEFDPVLISFSTIAPLVRAAHASQSPASVHAPRRFTLPVVYGGEYGPDLGFVAEHLSISESDVIALHTGEDRIVRCLGGPAASCMIDGPTFDRPIPRLADPRLEVPPNAISVAGRQGVIGPVRAPSGWRLIGLSPVSIMDMSAERLVPYRPGDVIRFREVPASDWEEFRTVHMHELAEAC